METGVETDMISLRPRTLDLSDRRRAAEDERRRDLKRKASGTVVVDSPAGKRIWRNLSALLQARIEKLIDADPEARAYKAMIDSLGMEYSQARMAVEAIQKRYIREP